MRIWYLGAEQSVQDKHDVKLLTCLPIPCCDQPNPTLGCAAENPLQQVRVRLLALADGGHNTG
jgi:hypothetical protein